MKKIFVPHGHFSRRFTHKRKRMFGLKVEVFDALNLRWMPLKKLAMDYALASLVDALPTSSQSLPHRRVSDSFVRYGHESWEMEATQRASQSLTGSAASKPFEHETLDRTRSHAVAGEFTRFDEYETSSPSVSEPSSETSSHSSYSSGYSDSSSSSSYSDSGSSFSGGDC